MSSSPTLYLRVESINMKDLIDNRSIPQYAKLKSKVLKMLACPEVLNPNLKGFTMLMDVVTDEVVVGCLADSPAKKKSSTKLFC